VRGALQPSDRPFVCGGIVGVMGSVLVWLWLAGCHCPKRAAPGYNRLGVPPVLPLIRVPARPVTAQVSGAGDSSGAPPGHRVSPCNCMGSGITPLRPLGKRRPCLWVKSCSARRRVSPQFDARRTPLVRVDRRVLDPPPQ